LRATPEDGLHFHVLHEGTITSDIQMQMRRLLETHGGRVDFDLIDDQLLGVLPTKGASLGGRISWARVLLPELLPEVERVIYVDADVLCVDSLSALWREDLGDAVLGAVRNVIEPGMHPHVAALGIADPRCYFNAGVLLVDLEAMRGQHSWERTRDFVAGAGQPLTWYDQDALNVVFAEQWKPLEPRWNAQNSFWVWSQWAADVLGLDALSDAVRYPAIVHFEGPAIGKPWHYLNPHPYRNHYLAILADTPWAGEPFVDRTMATRLIRQLPSNRRIPAYLKLEEYRRRVRSVAGRLRPA
jgi:lipopolysaccharide biosynthesis glycosyltransferase